MHPSPGTLKKVEFVCKTHGTCNLQMCTYYINSFGLVMVLFYANLPTNIRFICKSPSIGLYHRYLSNIRRYTFTLEQKLKLHNRMHNGMHTQHINESCTYSIQSRLVILHPVCIHCCSFALLSFLIFVSHLDWLTPPPPLLLSVSVSLIQFRTSTLHIYMLHKLWTKLNWTQVEQHVWIFRSKTYLQTTTTASPVSTKKPK